LISITLFLHVSLVVSRFHFFGLQNISGDGGTGSDVNGLIPIDLGTGLPGPQLANYTTGFYQENYYTPQLQEGTTIWSFLAGPTIDDVYVHNIDVTDGTVVSRSTSAVSSYLLTGFQASFINESLLYGIALNGPTGFTTINALSVDGLTGEPSVVWSLDVHYAQTACGPTAVSPGELFLAYSNAAVADEYILVALSTSTYAIITQQTMSNDDGLYIQSLSYFYNAALNTGFVYIIWAEISTSFSFMMSAWDLGTNTINSVATLTSSYNIQAAYLNTGNVGKLAYYFWAVEGGQEDEAAPGSGTLLALDMNNMKIKVLGATTGGNFLALGGFYF